MKKSRPAIQRIALLVTGLSGTILLAGCDMIGGVTNPLDSSPPKQVVMGTRHTPVLNQPAAAPAQPVAQSQPVVGSPKPAPTIDSDPFAYYSAQESGGKASTSYSSSSSAPSSSSTASSHNPVGDFFSSMLRDPLPPGTPAPAQPKTEEAVRKPLSGNPAINSGTTPAPAAVNEAPAASVGKTVVPSAAVSDDTPPWKAHSDASSDSGNSAPASTPPLLLERLFGKTDAPAKAPAIVDNGPIPPLSSVPPTPTEFKDIKAGQEQGLHTMQTENAEAQNAKQSLDDEPSQQQNNTVAETHTSHHVHTAPAPEAQAAPVANGPAPQRGVDIMTQSQWNALQQSWKNEPSSGATPDAQPAPDVAPQAQTKPAAPSDASAPQLIGEIKQDPFNRKTKADTDSSASGTTLPSPALLQDTPSSMSTNPANQ